MDRVKAVNQSDEVVGRNILKNLAIVLELYKIVEITAALRLAAEMTQNSN